MSSPEGQPSAQERRTASPSKQPLYIRLYFQSHLTELVRAIGYADLPVDDARKRIEPLIKQFGKEKIMQGCQEIVDVTTGPDPVVARLKTDVRKLAFQILGPPPDASASRKSARAAEGGDKKSEVMPPVKMPRPYVLPRYETHLSGSDQTFRTPAEIRALDPSLGPLKVLDYVVEKDGAQLLVTVRPFCTAKHVAQMGAAQHALRELYPNARCVRMWPHGTGEAWSWQEYGVNIAEQ